MSQKATSVLILWLSLADEQKWSEILPFPAEYITGMTLSPGKQIWLVSLISFILQHQIFTACLQAWCREIMTRMNHRFCDLDSFKQQQQKWPDTLKESKHCNHRPAESWSLCQQVEMFLPSYELLQFAVPFCDSLPYALTAFCELIEASQTTGRKAA